MTNTMTITIPPTKYEDLTIMILVQILWMVETQLGNTLRDQGSRALTGRLLHHHFTHCFGTPR